MSLIVAHDDVKPEQVRTKFRAGKVAGTSTTFLRASADKPNAPTAYLVRYNAAYFSSAHFHVVDQFQVLVEGRGKFGRHDMSPYTVHFSRAYTAYGPLVSAETGWGFLTLRTQYDPGAQHFPAAHDKLTQASDRRPWQITKKVTFAEPGPRTILQDIPEVKDEQGLFTCSLAMAPYARIVAPNPADGNGQYVIVVKGSLMHGKEYKALTIVFVKPDEDAFQIHAGAQGLHALILNFPQTKMRAVAPKKLSAVNGLKQWQCVLCSFAYDEALGMPEEGVLPGTRWEDVPADWTCPDCGSTKSDFVMAQA